MAKVTAPFEIEGTIDDLNFYKASEQNLVRLKGKLGITKVFMGTQRIMYTFIRINASKVK